MRRLVGFSAVLILCQLHSGQEVLGGTTSASQERGAPVPSLVVSRHDVVDGHLTVYYEIHNKTGQDIWICDDADVRGWDCDVCLSDDGRTLLVNRRMDVPLRSFRDPPTARYVRLPAQRSRPESLVLPLPVHLRSVFGGGAVAEGTVNCERVVIEIGYFAGDMPAAVHNVLEKAEKAGATDPDLVRVREHMSGLLDFYDERESMYLRHRRDEMAIYYNFQALRGEQVLRGVIEGLHVPYNERGEWPKLSPPDLTDCTRIEGKCEPSALEFFFPSPFEQGVFSGAEIEYLRSIHTVGTDDVDRIRVLAEEIREPEYGGTYTRGTRADLVCYRGGKQAVSFSVFDNAHLVTTDGCLYRYPEGIRSLRLLIPQVRPYELRRLCACNLDSLASRFQRQQMWQGQYFPGADWCDRS